MATDDELLDALAAALEPTHREPPADRVAALRAAAAATAARPAPAAPAHLRPSSGRARRILVGVVAAAAVFGAGFVTADQVTTDGKARPTSDELAIEFDGTLAAPRGDSAISAKATVTKTGIGRVIELSSTTLAILPRGEFYEVWFVGPGDGPDAPNRISAGTFHPDPAGNTDVRFAAAVDPKKYPVLEVTAEPGSGDPAPEGPIVVRADLS